MNPAQSRRRWGVALIVIGLALLAFFAVVAPRALVVASSAAILLFIFGGLMLSGRWPPQRS